jgi:hypothetical protein
VSDGVNVSQKLALFDDHWSPRTVATINDNKVVVVKAQGEFVWHSPAETETSSPS